MTILTSVMNRITVAIHKALQSKTQLLPYMRDQIMRDIVHNLRELKEEEIELYLKEHLSNEAKKEGQV